TEEGEAALPMKLPDHFAVVFSVQVTPSLQLNVDYKYSSWSDWPSIPFRFSKPVDLMRIAQIIQPGVAGKDFLNFDLKLEDTWNYAAGIEYQYNDRLALRLGIEDRPSSIPDDHKNALLPIGSGIFYGAGFGYRFEDNAVLDFGVAYFHTEFSIKPGESPMSNNTSQSKIIYNPYAGLPIDTELDVILIEASYSKEF
ncbi:MAG: outer membrane protein transport protein, partial [Pseudomonadales bacterium]|nr:outer membrane protein transport protein [Pseudomonadales bacterium]